jgi:hypothetical protein
MPQSCPHCGTALTGTIDAYCPECREDLSATPEEAAEKPTLDDMAEALKPVGIVWGGFSVAVGVVSSISAVLGGVAGREWELALCGAIGLAVCIYWFSRVRQNASARTSVTGKDKTSKSSEPTK